MQYDINNRLRDSTVYLWRFIMGYYAFRIRGEHTIDMIESLANLDKKELNGTLLPLKPKGTIRMELQASGFISYVYNHCKCTECGKPMELKRNKKGIAYLRCSEWAPLIC